MRDPLKADHLAADLKGRSIRGGALSLSSQGAGFVIQTVSTVVLARLLTPADFGLVAMVTAITGMGQAFAGLGLSEATIQRDHVTQDQVSTLFWINAGVGVVLTLATCAIAPVLVWVYHDPRLRDLTFALSLTFLIGGLRVQHEALLKRQMRFLALAVRDVSAVAVGVALGIIIALRGGGYWALIAIPLTSQFLQATGSWVLARWAPSLPRRHAGAKSMVVFGGSLTASYMTWKVRLGVCNSLIGWRWGAAPLGIYSKAFNLLMLPVNQLSGPIGNVVVPAFSRIQNDADRFARYFLGTSNLLVWAVGPLFGFLFVAARPVVLLVLGHQWTAAVPVFKILAIPALTIPLWQVASWSLVSRGETKRYFRLASIVAGAAIAGYAVGLPFGIKGVAVADALVGLVGFPWVMRYALHGTEVTLRRVGQAAAVPLSLSLAGTGAAELALHIIAPHGIISQLAVTALGFAAAVLVSVLVPAFRREMLSLKNLIAVFRLSRQSASD